MLVVLVIMLVERRTAKVHRAHGVADKGVDASILSLSIARTLSEVQVLRSQYSLRSHIVRIHALPTTRQRATMEDDLQTEVVGIGEDILVELHHGLLVATEEVDLDAQDAIFLHPCHLLATGSRLIHLALRRLGSIVP